MSLTLISVGKNLFSMFHKVDVTFSFPNFHHSMEKSGVPIPFNKLVTFVFVPPKKINQLQIFTITSNTIQLYS